MAGALALALITTDDARRVGRPDAGFMLPGGAAVAGDLYSEIVCVAS